MSEGQQNQSSSRKSFRCESVVPKTPDVLKHKPYKTYKRSQSSKTQKKTSRRNSGTLSPKPFDKKWYSSGYPALRAADKKIRELKARQESQKLREPKKSKRKSRSYSRGHSVYFNDDDPTIPHYRSKSVESFRRESSTFDPVVNEKDVISLTYTGRLSRENTGDSRLGSISGSRRCSVRSRRGSGIVQKKVESVVPHMRRNYDFDDLQTRIYQQIQKIYGEPDADIKNKQFFLTLAQIQSEHVRMKHLKMSKSDRMFLEKMFEEMTNIKKETGKILRNSTTRYSTQFEYPSPVNDKVRRLPRGRQDESFLTKMPKTRERLKLKPIRHSGHTRDHRHYKKYEQYENFNQRFHDKQIDQFQKVKEPENPSDMLKFLQQAERLLTEYSKGLLNHNEKGYGATFGQVNDNPSPSRHRELKPLHHKRTKSSDQKFTNVYGRTSPQKQTNISKNTQKVPSDTKAPVYSRPETFYDGRKHLQFHSRASLVDHQLYKAKRTGDASSQRHEFSLRGLAT